MSFQFRAVVLRKPLHTGVFKVFVKKRIRTDVAAGTSVGAVNASIIVGSKSDNPEEALKNFGWN
jgi:predicted acylesterase/phospholipase RssA